MGNQKFQAGRDIIVSGVVIQGEQITRISNLVRQEKGDEAAQKVTQLLMSLQEGLKKFPETQRKNAEGDLKHLVEELEKEPEQRRWSQIQLCFKLLVATTASVLVGIGVASEQVKTISTNAVDIVGNTKAITEEVQRIKGNSSEFKELSPSDWEVVKTVGIVSEGLSQIAEAYPLPTE